VRLLVTRPEPEASELAARLRSQGHTALAQPLMRIVFAPEPPGLPQPAAIAVTSRNGVRGLGRWPRAATWHRLPVFAVGDRTGDEARDAGFADVRCGSGDAAVLAAMIKADFAGRGAPLLYAAGRDRSVDLGALLAPLVVTTVEAYRGVAATELAAEVSAAIATRSLDGALFFSRRTATIFVDLVTAAQVVAGLENATLFALSPAVADPLRRLGAGSIAIARDPEMESLLALIPAPV
jgi:uroporphyrinogen-III synthase